MVGYLCLNLPILFANIVFCLALSLGVAAFLELDKDYP